LLFILFPSAVLIIDKTVMQNQPMLSFVLLIVANGIVMWCCILYIVQCNIRRQEKQR